MRELAEARFVSLESYRKDGSPVKTPLWAVDLDGDVAMWTGADSYKVKRLRRDPNARLARCNSSGKKILSGWVEVDAEVHDDAPTLERVVAAMSKKYTWQVWLIRLTLPFRSRAGRQHVCLRFRRRAA
jgi:uncharacterized protein